MSRAQLNVVSALRTETLLLLVIRKIFRAGWTKLGKVWRARDTCRRVINLPS